MRNADAAEVPEFGLAPAVQPGDWTPVLSDVRKNGPSDEPVTMRHYLGRAWWMAVPLVFSAVVTLPITGNFFFGDDLLNLYAIVNRPLGQTLLAPYGGHELFVRNGLMALQYALFGPAPAAYYWTAVLTHLGNVVLLAVLIRDLTRSERLACFGAALWGTSPVILGTIGWYATFGHALATTALLIVLIRIVRLRRRGTVSAAELAGWAVLLWAASTSFGVGIAFVLVLPVMAWLLLAATPLRRRIVMFLSGVAVLVATYYVAAQRLATAWYGVSPETPALDGVLRRGFGVLDIVVNQLAFGTDQLVLGPLARFVVDSWTGAAAVAAPIGALIAVAMWKASPQARRAVLAFLALSLATYGIIAAGRVPFYPTFKPLLVRADRYHYAAPMALAVVVCVALGEVRARSLTTPLRTAALALSLLALSVARATLPTPTPNAQYARDLTAVALASMDEMIHSAPPGEDVYIANQVFRGVGPMVVRVPRNFPGWAALFVVYHPSNVVEGRRVFFVEPDDEVRAAAADGIRSATLLVSPDDVAADRVRHARSRLGPGAGQ